MSARRGGVTLWLGAKHRPLAFRRVQPFDALLHDLDGLAHLLQAQEIPIVAVAVLCLGMSKSSSA